MSIIRCTLLTKVACSVSMADMLCDVSNLPLEDPFTDFYEYGAPRFGLSVRQSSAYIGIKLSIVIEWT